MVVRVRRLLCMKRALGLRKGVVPQAPLSVIPDPGKDSSTTRYDFKAGMQENRQTRK